MLRNRMLTAVVALPLLLAGLAVGPDWLIGLVFFLLAVLAWREYTAIIGRPLYSLTLIGWLASAVLMALLTWSNPAWLVLIIPLALVALAMAALANYGREAEAFRQMERCWLGLMLVLLPLGSMAGLALCLPHGRLWLVFLLAVVFGADTGAYFCGRAFGKAKLSPQISPNKTRAGAYGGLAVGLVLGVLFGALDGGPGLFDIVFGGIVGLVLAALSMVGDLLISMFKRTYKTKDTGSILPGHGGILDRLDSFTLAAPVLVSLLLLWKLLNG